MFIIQGQILQFLHKKMLLERSYYIILIQLPFYIYILHIQPLSWYEYKLPRY